MENKPHLLVVDDDEEIRGLLARLLAKHRFRVLTASDGKEMRKVLADWRIDLVVLDLMLPGEGGLALCRELRAHSDLPVIMLTAMGEEIDRDRGSRGRRGRLFAEAIQPARASGAHQDCAAAHPQRAAQPRLHHRAGAHRAERCDFSLLPVPRPTGATSRTRRCTFSISGISP